MSWIEVSDFCYPQGWVDVVDTAKRSDWYCKQLESGKILYFPNYPFDLDRSDIDFLLSQRREESSIHKNVSYRPSTDVLRGGPSAHTADGIRLRKIMRSYSAEIDRFIASFLKNYAGAWSKDYASYRPIEERGRELSLRKRNDLLHVDSFPSRPTGGGRILRLFSNLNREEDRVWLTTDSFAQLANRYAIQAGLDRIAAKSSSNGSSILGRLIGSARLKLKQRSPYDRFMLSFHNFLKENAEFQAETTKIRLAFPPGSTWIVYTDAVPHAVISGRFALEQTYIIPTGALAAPSQAPISILERLCGQSLSRASA